MSDSTSINILPPGTELHHYTLEESLGQGGFGIVYKAQHKDLGTVAIKEFLPTELATRRGVEVHLLSDSHKLTFNDEFQRFVEEAKRLVSFNHPNIVRCREFFRLNGTAYLVMDFEHGSPLKDLIRLRESQGESLEEAELLGIIEPLLVGLGVVHQNGVVHRDIKPDNIFIRRSTEQPVLIDFGSAKKDYKQAEKSFAPVTESYAAIEQIDEDGTIGPWTDIYAIGALMWRVLASDLPVSSQSRSFAVLRGNKDPLTPATELGAGRWSTATLQAIDRCMALVETERYQSTQDLLAALSGSAQIPSGFGSSKTNVKGLRQNGSKTEETSIYRQQPTQMQRKGIGQEEGQSRKNTNKAILALLGVVSIGAGATIYLWPDDRPYPSSDQVAETDSGRIVTPPVEETGRQASEETDGIEAVDIDQSPVEESQLEETAGDSVESPNIARNPAPDLPPPTPVRDSILEKRVEELAGEFIELSGGSYQMGTDDGERLEGPAHTETIQPFALAETEVTFSLWDECVEAGGCDYNPPDQGWGRGDQPVINVAFDHIKNQFIPWANRVTGNNYRLPTEAEWEYAARATVIGDYPWEGEAGLDHANFDSTRPEPVGSLIANGFGLQDMHGNVKEWVEDCWNGRFNYVESAGNGQAWLEGSCDQGIVRGGSWNSDQQAIRSASRERHPKNQSSNEVGFRLVQEN